MSCKALVMWSLLSVTALSKVPEPPVTLEVEKPAFSPVLGQSVKVRVDAKRSGVLTVVLLDRDGYPVRTLAEKMKVPRGNSSLVWDGKADTREIVPDEAYSIRATFIPGGKGRVYEYFPANQEAEMLKAVHGAYDPVGGTVTYTLPKAARIHMQLGLLEETAEKGHPDGPVLKTLVNRDPRTAGTVVETWNGYDERNQFYFGDSPNVAMQVMAISLPENAVITTGNQKIRFLEWIKGRRKTASLITWKPHHRHHHYGLSAEEDLSPPLTLVPENAKWLAGEKVWEVKGDELRILAKPDGETAAAFCAGRGTVHVFRGVKRLAQEPAPAECKTMLRVPVGEEVGTQIVAVNWSNGWGPSATASLRVKVVR